MADRRVRELRLAEMIFSTGIADHTVKLERIDYAQRIAEGIFVGLGSEELGSVAIHMLDSCY